MRFATALAALAAALPGFGAADAAAAAGTDYDRVLTVAFAETADAGDRVAARRAAGVQARASLAAPGLQQVTVPEGVSLSSAATALRANAEVDFVQLPGHYYLAALTNDPYLVNENLWGLDNHGNAFACTVALVAGACPAGAELAGAADADIDAPEAWDTYAGGAEPVAVVDTGVAWQHQDLAANIWTNPAEASGVAGVDDDPYVGSDGNPHAYVDDVRGWDFVGDLDDNGTPSDPSDDVRLPPDADPADPHGHGTHVAGIAGAVGNNLKGIAGVNPDAAIMPLRAADESGVFSFGAIEEAFTYAIDHGAKVINGSFSGPSPSPGMSAIIFAHPEVLFVFAAGNVSADHDAASGAEHGYPCDITAPNVICVAATNWNDSLASFSDYGYDSVDLAAPGSAILSTISSASDPRAGGDYDYKFKDGTSMASPHVAGAASLIWSAHPTLESSQVKTLILQSLDPLPSLAGKVGFGGRLNLDKAIKASNTPPQPGWPSTPPPPASEPPTPPPSEPLPSTPPTILDTRPPDLRVATRKPRAGTRSISFGVTCGESCTITVKARPNVRKARTLTKRYTGQAGIARSITVKFDRATVQRLRGALDRRGRVGVFVSVTVADAAGNKTGPKSFRVSLVR